MVDSTEDYRQDEYTAKYKRTKNDKHILRKSILDRGISRDQRGGKRSLHSIEACTGWNALKLGCIVGGMPIL